MRLIDADALQALFNEVSTSLLGKAELCKDTEHMVRAFIMTTEMIQDAPTVDAVPVVRCRECKFSRELNKCEKKLYLDNCRACECSEASQDGYMIVFPEYFCSYGERREDHEGR